MRAHFDGTKPSDMDVFVFSKENYGRLVLELRGRAVPGTGGCVHQVDGPASEMPVEIVFDPECPDVPGCVGYSDLDVGSGVYCAGRFTFGDNFVEAVKTRTMHVRLARVQNPQRTYLRCMRYSREYGYRADGSVRNLLKLWRESAS